MADHYTKLIKIRTMRHLLIWIGLIVFPILSYAQSEFPYSRILRMSPEELKEQKFRYSTYENQYVLSKSSGDREIAAVLGALNGTQMHVAPDKDDYKVVLQYGDSAVSSLVVTLYNDDTYLELLDFAQVNGQNVVETNLSAMNKLQFDYDGLSFELQMDRVGIASSGSIRNNSTSKDESYSVYTYSIFTGHEANSPKIQREAQRQQRRDNRNAKKRTAAELM